MLKLFDCVDHNILCKKLEGMGLNSSAWFKSYLTNREQVVIINGTSEPCIVKCGVPQGSILGPLLFLCYVNDMPNSVNITLFQYADDSAILASGKTISDIISALNHNLNECYNWLVDNKLSMHPGKTELILFVSKSKLKKVKNFQVKFENYVTHATTSVKYLGLNIDNHLSGDDIVQSIVKG